MIIIVGNKGEGSGLLTNIAIENLLKSKPGVVVILLDDTSEFVLLSNKLNGTIVNIGVGYNPIEDRNIDNSNLYVVRCDEPLVYNLNELKKLENMFLSKHVFVIYKTTNIEEASLIKNEYDRLGQ